MGSPDMIIHNYPEHEGVSRYKMEPPLSALRLRRSHISRPINNEEKNHFYQLCYMLAHWNFHREPSKLTCIRNMTPAALVFVKVKFLVSTAAWKWAVSCSFYTTFYAEEPVLFGPVKFRARGRVDTVVHSVEIFHSKFKQITESCQSHVASFQIYVFFNSQLKGLSVGTNVVSIYTNNPTQCPKGGPW